jgi:predicted TIM-barrel fold metal-dependent hydrolase
MDAAGVERAGVIAIEPFIGNEVVFAAARQHPARLVPIASVNPLAPLAAESVETLVVEHGARAIKVHPRLQRFGVEAAQQLIAVARQCGEQRVPLVICSFQGGPDLFRSQILELCACVAEAAASADIVMAHAGGHRVMDALLLSKAHRNIYLDLSFTPLYFKGSSVEQDFAYLMRKADRQRLLFGSDFPEVSIAESVATCTASLESLRIPASEIEAVLGLNAVRLLLR